VATFPGTTLDESEYAKIVTDYLGIDHTFINVDPNKYIDEFENDLYMFEEVYLTSPVPMMATYRAVKENGVTVTLDGHGADELFCGYAFDFFAAFPDAHFRKKYVDEILQTYSDQYPHDGSNLDVGYYDKRYDLYFRYVAEYYPRKLLHREDMIMFPDRAHPAFKKLQALNQKLYIESHITTLPTLLRNYDHYSMANGVEIRMPFMDYRLVTLAFALKWNTKLRDGYSKAIIRDALKPFMPKEIVERKTKIGFNTPIAEWMQGAMKEYFEDLVNSQDFNNSSLINPETVRKNILSVTEAPDKVSFGQASNAYESLVPYLWEKCFYKRASTME
jgi:asparagine synthase (glutamine-hydrolysing)